MDKLIFVYNADGGLANMFKDWAHKIFSPETYACSLCTLTFDNLGMRRSWQRFIQTLGYEVEFLHRDELEKQYGINDISLPAVFILQNGKPKLWIKFGAMDVCESLDELQTLVTQKLAHEAG